MTHYGFSADQREGHSSLETRSRMARRTGVTSVRHASPAEPNMWLYQALPLRILTVDLPSHAQMLRGELACRVDHAQLEMSFSKHGGLSRQDRNVVAHYIFDVCDSYGYAGNTACELHGTPALALSNVHFPTYSWSNASSQGLPLTTSTDSSVIHR